LSDGLFGFFSNPQSKVKKWQVASLGVKSLAIFSYKGEREAMASSKEEA
jgi:hypothetical protein